VARRFGDWSAGWYAGSAFIALVVSGFIIWDGPPHHVGETWLLLTVPVSFWLACEALRQLSAGFSGRGIAWLMVDFAVLAKAFAVAFTIGGLARWIVFATLVFGAPFIATHLTGVRER
jgi:hypothetical protein